MESSVNELRQKVAISMRVLGMHGLVKEITGHVSARIPGTNDMFVRCRGGNERGLMYSGVQQVRRTDFNGKQSPGEGFMLPIELPIHGEIYKARPEVQAVVHAHPYASLLCGILGLEFQPIWGAYEPAGLAIAAAGVPVYPRSILISRPELGQDLVNALEGGNYCLMKGHGITAVGPSVESATLLAIRLENLARMHLEIAQLGRQPPRISDEDLEAFRDQISGGRQRIPRGEDWTWSYYVQLVRDRMGIPEDFEPEA